MKPLVVKVGGALLENADALQALFAALNAAKGELSRPLVWVHGGGIVVQNLMSALNLQSDKIDGLRVTPAEHMPYVTGALAGTSNKTLVAAMLAAGLPAVGLSLGDGASCDIETFDERLGQVGNAIAKDGKLLNTLLAAEFIPVLSSIGINSQGELFNVNADQAALAVARLVGGEVVYLTDVAGVLDANKALIPQLNSEKAEQLIADGVIRDGMIVKVRSALEAASFVGGAIYLTSWQDPANLVALLKGQAVGTRIS